MKMKKKIMSLSLASELSIENATVSLLKLETISKDLKWSC